MNHLTNSDPHHVDIDSQRTNPSDSGQSDPLFGAADIVEAFTALRHELKLQVRGGRELQQSLADSLQRIESCVSSAPSHSPLLSTEIGDARQLAEAVAEIEEFVQRAVDSLLRQSRQTKSTAAITDQFDDVVENSSWLARLGSRRLMGRLRSIVEQNADDSQSSAESLNVSQQGLELLLARIHRLMQACDLKRMDVIGQVFDVEKMRAIDVIDSSGTLSNHVAEQLRPGYVWRNEILRYADVRLAK